MFVRLSFRVVCYHLACCLRRARQAALLKKRPGISPEQFVEQTETDRLNVWLDEQYEQQLDFSPQTRSVLGDKTDYDQLNEVTLEAQQRRLDWQRQSVATMRSEFEYQALNEDGKLSFDMWEYALEQAEAAYPYRNYGYILGVVDLMHHCPVS